MGCRCAEIRKGIRGALRRGAVVTAARLVVEGAVEMTRQIAPPPRRTLPKPTRKTGRHG